MPKIPIKQGLDEAGRKTDPMRGAIDSDHSQAPRGDIKCDDMVLDRNSFKADTGYDGPNRMSTSDSCNDPDEWSEKS